MKGPKIKKVTSSSEENQQFVEKSDLKEEIVLKVFMSILPEGSAKASMNALLRWIVSEKRNFSSLYKCFFAESLLCKPLDKSSRDLFSGCKHVSTYIRRRTNKFLLEGSKEKAQGNGPLIRSIFTTPIKDEILRDRLLTESADLSDPSPIVKKCQRVFVRVLRFCMKFDDGLSVSPQCLRREVEDITSEFTNEEDSSIKKCLEDALQPVFKRHIRETRHPIDTTDPANCKSWIAHSLSVVLFEAMQGDSFQTSLLRLEKTKGDFKINKILITSIFAAMGRINEEIEYKLIESMVTEQEECAKSSDVGAIPASSGEDEGPLASKRQCMALVRRVFQFSDECSSMEHPDDKKRRVS